MVSKTCNQLSLSLANRCEKHQINRWRRLEWRPFAWEDKFKRLLLRFERIQQRHYGMKLMAYTLINLRKFCGT